MCDGGTYRYGRYSALEYDAVDGIFRLLPHAPYEQSKGTSLPSALRRCKAPCFGQALPQLPRDIRSAGKISRVVEDRIPKKDDMRHGMLR